VIEQVAALSEWGAPVDVWCCEDGKPLDMEAEIRAASPHVREVERIPSAGRLFWRLVRRRPSLVVICTVQRGYRALLRQRRTWFAGKPAVLETIHERYAWSLADERGRRRETIDLWCMTHDVREDFRRVLGIPPERTAIARPLFRSSLLSVDDEARAAARALRASLGIAESSFVVGYLGRLGENKGIHHLPRLVGRLVARGADAHLVVAGRFMPPLAAYERAFRAEIDAAVAAEPRLGGRIHLLGAVPAREPVYAAFDALAMVSTTEGLLPLTLVEALSLGIPVVTTDVGGIGQCLVDGVHAGVVRKVPDDESQASPEVLAQVEDRLARLALDPAERRRLGDAGRARVRELVAGNDFARDFRDAAARALVLGRTRSSWRRG
jgi:glycosyltransferase involved in cell wall biosynthesis